MSDFTDDDVAAACEAAAAANPDRVTERVIRAALAAVAPAIATRAVANAAPNLYEAGYLDGGQDALREAADEIERISILAQKSSDGWLRGMAAAANVVRARAEQVGGDEGHTHEFRNSDVCTGCGKSMDNIRSSDQAGHDYRCSCGMSFDTFRGLRTHQGKSRRDGWDNPGTPKWAAHLTGGRRGPERGSGVAEARAEQVNGDE